MNSSYVEPSRVSTLDLAPSPVLLIDPRGEDPIRARILGLERLESHARLMARACTLAPRRRANSPLLERFVDNKRVLSWVHDQLSTRGDLHLIDAEWLVDNFHIIEDSLREVARDLPPGYDAQLPKISAPPLVGYPRVYALALALVAHTDSELDETRIVRFVSAFQETAPLTIGELWALPTMLRLVLVDNLRRLSEKMIWRWEERRRAEQWAKSALADTQGPYDEAKNKGPSQAPPPLAELSDPFVVRLLQLLRDQGPVNAAVEHLEAELSAHGSEPNEVLKREQSRQAADQVTVGNCVLSLRLLSAIDWNAFFEKSSPVEAILRDDPAGIYPRQEFATSDRYRRVVEIIARQSDADEMEVSRKAVELAVQGRVSGEPRDHVGFYLIDRGQKELKSAFRFRPTWRERLLDLVLGRPQSVYFGSIVIGLAALLALVVIFALGGSLTNFWWILAIAAAALLPLSELVVGLVNQLFTLFVPPRVLPKLDVKHGIPTEHTTFVVIPSLLARPASGAVLLERLELHYLANPDPSLRFALLTDFTDAPRETMPQDEGIIVDALERVRALNDRYAPEGTNLFFLFHRRRLWNEAQGCWMGWERKRGKLLEFNRLLRGARDTSYAVLSADPAALPRIGFVITLDADTQMPRDTAGRLVGTLAHPLNRPRLDPNQERVTTGYGVLQPRISFHLAAATHSRFAALLATAGGIDPYSTAASDAYMDLFGVGSFTGKGIYDVDAFEAATGSRFPENHILSHDLIEGNFARCGLISDTELFDDFPALYHAYARREHRWVRGDWQLLPWLGRRVPTPKGWRPNPLPLLERWKLADNLRRSLVPPALLVLLLLGWTVLPGSPWLWSGVALATLGLPLIQSIIGSAVESVRGRSLAGLYTGLFGTPAVIGQVLLDVTFLAYRGVLLLDAVIRTLVRLLWTRRKLLEWETAASTELRLKGGLVQFVSGMWVAPALAIAMGTVVLLVRPAALPAAGPFLLAWFLSPAVAFRVSQPRPIAQISLADDERRALRRIARKTWQFFEIFVGEDDHWLPPDNFQEVPDGRIAHRTSPTNTGLLLLSTLAAHDLGYIGLSTLIDRLERTFDTFDRLEKHWGHFYNWYDTRTMQPLSPRYISTVDSGNLLGCLIALKQGLLEKCEKPVVGPTVIEGLADTVFLVAEQTGEDCRRLKALLDVTPGDLAEWDSWLEEVEDAAVDLAARTDAKDSAAAATKWEAGGWTGRLVEQVRSWRAEVAAAVAESRTKDWQSRLRHLADRAEDLAAMMDFRPLYKPDRHLFAIGFNLAQGKLDNACYDLLASEACLTSYLAVARGEAPRRHWFQLGRHFISAGGKIGLLSWGGTIFEYLMPRLLLRSLPGTILTEACRTAVTRQIEYGRHLGIPWGVSESAFSAQYPDGDYQYQAFGVPGLGLKQGLENEQVVAPYATVLAAMLVPHEALDNIRRLAQEGADGPFGLYEAIDYTRGRIPADERRVVMRSYMAHHQGMSLVALANTLLNDVMPKRFHAEPLVRALELLLQERLPSDPEIIETTEAKLTASTPSAADKVGPLAPMSRRLTSPATPAPRTNLLSNTQYHVMITNAGSGYSICRGMDVTRWREDPTCETWGQFCYIRDLQRDLVWSAGYQPVCKRADEYEVIFAADKSTIRRRDGEIETLIEVTVSPEQPVEVRRVTLTNHDSRPRELDLTSYSEVVLAPHRDDLAHPAFGKLFLETEWVASSGALLCRRRPRSVDEPPICAVHVAAVEVNVAGSATVGERQYETDRCRFIGRGRTVANPAALDSGSVLSGTVGPVLDPVFCLRQRVRLKPGGSATIALATAVASTRAEGLALADQYRQASAASRVFELAWAHSQIEHRHSDRFGEAAHLFQRLAAHVLFAGSALRADRQILASNTLGQEGLWTFGISGDRPIVVARFGATDEIHLARELLAAQTYLHGKGLELDLVLLNDQPAGHEEELNRQLMSVVRTDGGSDRIGQPGGIFLLKAAELPEDGKILIQAAARVVLVGDAGSLASQLDRTELRHPLPGPLTTSHEHPRWQDEPATLPSDLLFPNGLGGFTPDGREYCLFIRPDDRAHSRGNGQPVSNAVLYPRLAPAPWINVVANPGFGFLISESGSGYTWSQNSQANRLTPWSNDPVADPPGEVVYLRDEENGDIWSPTPLPAPSSQPTLVRHGQGYTTFEQNAYGLFHELTLLVAADDPVKLIVLRIQNLSDRPRRLSATYYAEWVVGSTRDAAAMHVVTEVDPETGALLARNTFRTDFGSRVAFADVDRRPRSFTADRAEFVGRHGSMMAPAALGRVELSGATGEALDPCAAIQVAFSLEAGAKTQLVFLLGEAEGPDVARALIKRYREEGRAASALSDVKARWDELLETVQVRTPDPALDLLTNRWLLYQVLSCRVWGRSAFYQSGGAYGFRDQLQDVMALFHAAPDLARAHILRAAARQFPEGDVQHWWHPPKGRGVRTRIADDPLWLVFVTQRYVTVTGDSAILDEPIPYLNGPPLKPGQDDDYGLPKPGAESRPLYEHCLRALEYTQRLGAHGLPLMGHGDWNDGMNRVGSRGKGESVWLTWFSIICRIRFAAIALERGDDERSAELRRQADELRLAVEESAWDGEWYRRAYFDDGTPLGSSQNSASKIDSIAQTWAVLSGGGSPERQHLAMQAVNDLLVREADRLILLFDPPFDGDALDPGYIKGYLPGVRENGGQYTHAATWVVQAVAGQRQGQRAYRLLSIINPVLHADDPNGVERYKVEPYVVAGDVYSRAPHVGRGGWTWYTGSAGWFYRVIVESILGIERVGDRLAFNPCVPPDWSHFEMTYRLRSTTYLIKVQNPAGVESGVAAVWLDNARQPSNGLRLTSDGKNHEVRVVMGALNETDGLASLQ